MTKEPQFTEEEVRKALDGAATIKQFLMNLGLNPSNGNYRRARSIVHMYELELPKADFTVINDVVRMKNQIPSEEFFVLGVSRSGPSIRKRLVRDFNWDYICNACGLNPNDLWNGKELTLQVDHIDGDHMNNLLDNLQFLCPNCHTQTTTYARKNGENKYSYCACGARIGNLSTECIKCSNTRTNEAAIGVYSIEYPEIDVIVNTVISEGGWVPASRILGIGDNSLRKHLKRNGVDPKSIQYTRKITKVKK